MMNSKIILPKFISEITRFDGSVISNAYYFVGNRLASWSAGCATNIWYSGTEYSANEDWRIYLSDRIWRLFGK